MKNIIEVNGRKYDAITGKLLALEPRGPSIKTATQVDSKTSAVMDGVRWRKPPTSMPKIKAATTTPKAAAHPATAKAEKSYTLIRRIVKKPFAPGRIFKTPATSGSRQLFGNPPTGHPNQAGQIKHNSSISHFGRTVYSQPKLSSNLKVMPPPKNSSAPAAAPFLSKPPKHRRNQPPAFRHPLNILSNASIPAAKLLPRERIIAPVKRLHFSRKVLKIATIVLGCLVVLVAAAVIVYKKVPAADMQLADFKAGFSGHIPAIVPAGYSFMTPIVTQKNVIAIQYKSDVNRNQFAITQKPSSWNSTSLASNYLASSGLQYQTYNAPDGLTIYIFNVGNATWIDSGIWYTITGTDSLTTNQILSIADSM